MATSKSQASTFLDKEDKSPKDIGPNEPQVSFAAALVLTRKQETKMVNWALTRKEDMEREQGRNLVTISNNWFQTSTNLNADRYTFMGKRSLWELTYNNKLWWRKFIYGQQSIFNQSNLTSATSHRITCQMIAQAIDYFFGTDPWFSTEPVGNQEDDLADCLDEFAQEKTKKSYLKNTLCRAIEGAFVRGESVVKTTYEVEEIIYESFANVLIDPDGKYILDANGDWITDKDSFTDEMASEMDPTTGKIIPDSKQPTGNRVLKKDMTTPEPPEKNYQARKIMRRSTSFKGAKSDVLFWQDVLIPETCAHVQRGGADIVIHLSDMSQIRLIDLYKRRGMTLQSPDQEVDEMKKALALLRKTKGSGSVKTALKTARPEIGENIGYIGEPVHEPVMEIAECYMTYDANEDGIQEEIVCVIDVQSRIPLFYDYLPNVTPDGMRPFDVVRCKPISGRYYGIGSMELFEKSQKAIDLMLNRWNFSQSGSGVVRFWNPANTAEGEQNPHLVLNTGQTYTLLKDKTSEMTLSYVPLPEIKGKDLYELIQYFGQLVMSEAGVSTANDAASAGLDTTKTATGINNIQSTNSVAGNFYWNNLEPSLQDITKRNVIVEFARAETIDVLRLFDGDHHKLETLMSEDAQDIELNVSFLLSKAKNQQLIQNALSAANLSAQYYALPIPVQHRLEEVYQGIMRSLDFENVDEIIDPLDEAFGPMQPQQPGDPNAPAGQPGAPEAPPQQGQPPAEGSEPPPSASASTAAVNPVKPGTYFALGQKGGQ